MSNKCKNLLNVGNNLNIPKKKCDTPTGGKQTFVKPLLGLTKDCDLL